MDLPGQDEDRQPLTDDRITVSAAFEGSEEIATARILARQFLLDLREDHGLPISAWTTGVVELVVSELVTNAHKYAPRPRTCHLRAGRGCLEIVMAVCQSFEVHREPVGKRLVACVRDA
jgi:hypothetical protein